MACHDGGNPPRRMRTKALKRRLSGGNPLENTPDQLPNSRAIKIKRRRVAERGKERGREAAIAS